MAAVPDLHPRNKGFPHGTPAQLAEGIMEKFNEVVWGKGLEDDERIRGRFHVFCFKYDLEALLLASPKGLAARLGVGSVPITWRIPVEDQNDETPPKRVVERLFAEHGKKYKGTADAPIILESCRYSDLVRACPQCFGPFVAFLEGL